MSRRRQASRRPQSKDAKFNSTLVSRLVNTVMGQGKKSVAQRIVYGAFDEIATKNPTTNPLDVLQRAVDKAEWGFTLSLPAPQSTANPGSPTLN